MPGAAGVSGNESIPLSQTTSPVAQPSAAPAVWSTRTTAAKRYATPGSRFTTSWTVGSARTELKPGSARPPLHVISCSSRVRQPTGGAPARPRHLPQDQRYGSLEPSSGSRATIIAVRSGARAHSAIATVAWRRFDPTQSEVTQSPSARTTGGEATRSATSDAHRSSGGFVRRSVGGGGAAASVVASSTRRGASGPSAEGLATPAT